MCLMAIKTSLSVSVVIIKYQTTQVLDWLHLLTTYENHHVCFASVTLYSISFQDNSLLFSTINLRHMNTSATGRIILTGR